MEALAITASEWVLLLSSSSSFVTAISDNRMTNIRSDEIAKPYLVEENDGKLWMT
jgi:hypothetical protein